MKSRDREAEAGPGVEVNLTDGGPRPITVWENRTAVRRARLRRPMGLLCGHVRHAGHIKSFIPPSSSLFLIPLSLVWEYGDVDRHSGGRLHVCLKGTSNLLQMTNNMTQMIWYISTFRISKKQAQQVPCAVFKYLNSALCCAISPQCSMGSTG